MRSNFSIKAKALLLFFVSLSVFFFIIVTSYFFTNKNIKTIESIDTHILPLNILHNKNFFLLEKLMNDFSDVVIMNDKGGLLQTQNTREKLLHNLDNLSQYNVETKHLKSMLENYYVKAYSLTSYVLQGKLSMHLVEAKEVQETAREILLKFKELKEMSNTMLVTSLKDISNDSKVFFSQSIIISIIGFFFIFFISIFIYFNINRRYQAITALLENLAIDNPDFALKIKDDGNDELSKLIFLFNKISKKLENMNGVLKIEIAQAIKKTKRQEQELMYKSRLEQMGEMISIIMSSYVKTT